MDPVKSTLAKSGLSIISADDLDDAASKSVEAAANFRIMRCDCSVSSSLLICCLTASVHEYFG